MGEKLPPHVEAEVDRAVQEGRDPILAAFFAFGVKPANNAPAEVQEQYEEQKRRAALVACMRFTTEDVRTAVETVTAGYPDLATELNGWRIARVRIELDEEKSGE